MIGITPDRFWRRLAKILLNLSVRIPEEGRKCLDIQMNG